jgi:hypothetical protein
MPATFKFILPKGPSCARLRGGPTPAVFESAIPTSLDSARLIRNGRPPAFVGWYFTLSDAVCCFGTCGDFRADLNEQRRHFEAAGWSIVVGDILAIAWHAEVAWIRGVPARFDLVLIKT